MSELFCDPPLISVYKFTAEHDASNLKWRRYAPRGSNYQSSGEVCKGALTARLADFALRFCGATQFSGAVLPALQPNDTDRTYPIIGYAAEVMRQANLGISELARTSAILHNASVRSCAVNLEGYSNARVRNEAAAAFIRHPCVERSRSHRFRNRE